MPKAEASGESLIDAFPEASLAIGKRSADRAQKYHAISGEHQKCKMTDKDRPHLSLLGGGGEEGDVGVGEEAGGDEGVHVAGDG